MSGLGIVCLWVSDFTVVFSSVYVQVYAIISHGQRCFMFRIFFYFIFSSLSTISPTFDFTFYCGLAHSIPIKCVVLLFFSFLSSIIFLAHFSFYTLLMTPQVLFWDI